MYLENRSVDAVITDRNGRTIEVDCRVTEPTVGGLSASISIEIPLNGEEFKLEQPCSLIGGDEGLQIEIHEMFYRSIPTGLTRRKHARGIFQIAHAARLLVKRSYWPGGKGRLRFFLSPIRFFKEHDLGQIVNYSSTPSMMVDLFKIKIPDLGDLRFVKFWGLHTVDRPGVQAEICADYAVEVEYEEGANPDVELLAEKVKAILVPLSILSRQAITLHGWVWEKWDGVETMWIQPLDPNLAPDMAMEPGDDVCFPGEFDACAQALVSGFTSASADKQEAVRLLSVALAPHVKRPTSGNFSALFGALEESIGLEKLNKEEKVKLHETDPQLVSALKELKSSVVSAAGPHAAILAGRIEGLASSVAGSGPSFKVRFDKFVSAYPVLPLFMSDLWPIFGNDKLPGLKQIRDSLAHGLNRDMDVYAVAVAHWHFSRLAERLAFIVLGVDVPRGLHLNSSWLGRESWYDRSVWERVRSEARKP